MHNTTHQAKLIVKAQTLDIETGINTTLWPSVNTIALGSSSMIRKNVAICFVIDPLGVRQLPKRTRNFSFGSTLSHHAPGLSLS